MYFIYEKYICDTKVSPVTDILSDIVRLLISIHQGAKYKVQGSFI